MQFQHAGSGTKPELSHRWLGNWGASRWTAGGQQRQVGWTARTRRLPSSLPPCIDVGASTIGFCCCCWLARHGPSPCSPPALPCLLAVDFSLPHTTCTLWGDIPHIQAEQAHVECHVVRLFQAEDVERFCLPLAVHGVAIVPVGGGNPSRWPSKRWCRRFSD